MAKAGNVRSRGVSDRGGVNLTITNVKSQARPLRIEENRQSSISSSIPRMQESESEVAIYGSKVPPVETPRKMRQGRVNPLSNDNSSHGGD